MIAGAGTAHAQLGSLISPGRLSAPHGNLEGLANCSKCHEQGRRVTAQKCLACHQPIAERIARKVGVHKTVTNDCVTCHAEHAGVDGVVRPFDQTRFDHAITGFRLDGRHASVAAQCMQCHKTRSFLTAKPACASCHTDVHKGALGATCTSCHSTRTAFRVLSGQFDHGKSAFPLLGAHGKVACAQCHVNKTFKGLKFGACTNCHQSPHRQELAPTCKTCHTNDTWRTTRVNHAQTAFALKGRHAAVACAACHRQPAMKVKPRSDTCAGCHVDVHRGAFKKDCGACHSENGFTNAPFDHGQTAFALTGMHLGIVCAKCHKNVTTTLPPGPGRKAAAMPARRAALQRNADFRGLNTACASCHSDVHQGELGPRCESCHSSKTFRLASFTHPRAPEFFAGSHAPVTCVKCHTPQSAAASAQKSATPARPVRYKNVSMSCVTCHQDTHKGQFGSACESCHKVTAPTFASTTFSHTTTAFPLTGKHTSVTCAQCHKSQFKGTSTTCSTCHADVHLGQFTRPCETCHATTSFALPGYKHERRPVPGFFAGRHLTPTCSACHKPTRARFPAGSGTATLFRVSGECVTCHADVHRGSLGSRCIECHRP